jgi:hypothetical protein
MNAWIRHTIAALCLVILGTVTARADWTANVSSNQSYSGTAVIPTGVSNLMYTQYWGCYLGTTICDGPYGNETMNAGASPDSYTYTNQTYDYVTQEYIVAGGSYPVYLDQYGSPSGSGFAGVDFFWTT